MRTTHHQSSDLAQGSDGEAVGLLSHLEFLQRHSKVAALG